jgi:hypothetical protein
VQHGCPGFLGGSLPFLPGYLTFRRVHLANLRCSLEEGSAAGCLLLGSGAAGESEESTSGPTTAEALRSGSACFHPSETSTFAIAERCEGLQANLGSKVVSVVEACC